MVFLPYFAMYLLSAQVWGRIVNGAMPHNTLNLMEQLNRIELRGKVGNLRLATVGESRVINFSLATNIAYKGKDGQGVVETTWHNVVAWSGRNMPDFDKIQKGTSLYILGRIRNTSYTGQDGVERQSYEVLARKMEFEDITGIQSDF